MQYSELFELMKVKATKPKQPQKKSLFLGSGDAVLYKLGTGNVPQLLHASFAVPLYVEKKVRFEDYIITFP